MISSIFASLLLAACVVVVFAHDHEHPNSKWNVGGVKVLSRSPLLDEELAMAEALGSEANLPFSASLDAFDVENLHFRTQSNVLTAAATYGIAFTASTQNPLHGLQNYATVNYWSVGGSPNASDIIAVYYSGANITTTSPIKYLYCNNDPNYLSTGNGTQTIYLVNGRQSVWVGYFLQATLNPAILSPVSSTIENPVLVAYTPVLSWDDVAQPMHPRIALTHNVGELAITWTQQKALKPILKVGLQSAVYDHNFYPTNSTYYQSQMCGAPANSAGWVEPGIFYTALVNGLSAGTKYYYSFGDDGTEMSAEYSFIVPSKPATGQGKTWTAFLFGDLGTDIGSIDQSLVNGNEGNDIPALNVSLAMRAAFTDLQKANPNTEAIVMHFGDISYANGWEADWDYFHYEITPLSATIPWMTGEGNHERDAIGTNDNGFGNDAGGECGIAYQTRFPMPRVIDSQRGDYWSVDFNNVHFVMWDTEIPYQVNSPQWIWLQNDLKSVDRCKTPYVISMAHRPMVVDSTNTKVGGGGAQPLAADLRTNIEPLFQQYRVDLHLSGHHHSYQRSCPSYNLNCTSGWGTVYMVVGTAGASFTQDPQSPQPSWVQKYVNNINGYLQATITDNQMSFVFYHTNNAATYISYDTFSIANQGLCTTPSSDAALNAGVVIINTFFPLFVLVFLFLWH